MLNNFLLWLGIIDQPLTILHTNFAVYIGIVYAYVPFMVLPIYTALIRIDYSLVEAALDLGARPLKTFFTVIMPLTKGGIIAGSMLVFIPAVGEFVIPELLGGPDSIMIGRVLWQEFFNNRDWPVASAVAIIMLLLLIVPIMWVIMPLTKGGIIAGSMLVFIPAVGEFVIPELLGGPDSIMIGRVLWQEFFNNRDWPVASAVAIIMLLLLIVPIMWFHKHQQKSVGEHG